MVNTAIQTTGPLSVNDILTINGIAAVPTLLSSGSPYTVLSTDNILLVTTGASNFIINLPAASANAGREIVIIKVDTGAGYVIITANGSDVVQGQSTQNLTYQYMGDGVCSDGISKWFFFKQTILPLQASKGIGGFGQFMITGAFVRLIETEIATFGVGFANTTSENESASWGSGIKKIASETVAWSHHP